MRMWRRSETEGKRWGRRGCSRSGRRQGKGKANWGEAKGRVGRKWERGNWAGGAPEYCWPSRDSGVGQRGNPSRRINLGRPAQAPGFSQGPHFSLLGTRPGRKGTHLGTKWTQVTPRRRVAWGVHETRLCLALGGHWAARGGPNPGTRLVKVWLLVAGDARANGQSNEWAGPLNLISMGDPSHDVSRTRCRTLSTAESAPEPLPWGAQATAYSALEGVSFSGTSPHSVQTGERRVDAHSAEATTANFQARDSMCKYMYSRVVR